MLDLLSAPVLFFLLGVFACLVRSDLEVPQPIPKLLSLYLLVCIGLKGGVELRAAEASLDVFGGLGAAVLLSAVVPIWTFFLLRKSLGPMDAAGVAATYGSISAVTFLIAITFLESRDVPYGGHMVAAMALMESPAIIVAIVLARMFGNADAADLGVSDDDEDRDSPPADFAPDQIYNRLEQPAAEDTTRQTGWSTIVHEALFNSAVLLLIGSMAIGLVIGKQGFADLAPFADAPFKGVLCLFLLDMGLMAARRLGKLRKAGPIAIGFGLLVPPVHAMIGIGLAYFLGLGAGDAMLLAVLSGSASYIAVPAALRLSLPAANASVYVPMSLGLTFPFNVVIGIPLYWAIITALWGGAAG